MKILNKLHQKCSGVKTIVRSKYYRAIVHEKSGSFRVLGSIKIYNAERVILGNRTTINHGCVLNAMALMTIGDDVRLSPGVIINTGGLDYRNTGQSRNHLKEEVLIESGVWIGSGAIINPGVTIGKNSVIGAGSVVTKDIPANVVAVGIPAVVKKNIS